MKHWTYPHETPTRYEQIYTACKIYVDLNEVCYSEDEITCKKCKQLKLEYDSEELDGEVV